MDLRVVGCKDGRWMELVHIRVQWRALVLAVSVVYMLQNLNKIKIYFVFHLCYSDLKSALA